jgi:hypothetical protein
MITLAQEIDSYLLKYRDNVGDLYTVDIADIVAAAADDFSGQVSIIEDTTKAIVGYFPESTGTDTRSYKRFSVPGIRRGDDQGHIVAKELGGSGTNLNNLFAQDRNYNQGRRGSQDWRNFESDTVSHLNNSGPRSCPPIEFLDYTIFLAYDDAASLRPTSVLGLAGFTDGTIFVTPGWIPNP